MKKNIIVCGLIAGGIVAGVLSCSLLMSNGTMDFENGMLLGYASMLLAFSLVYVGIKNARDKYGDGVISFGGAFKTGFYISLIASTMYVLVWLIAYYFFIPDFMDKYATHALKQAQESGLSQLEIDKKAAEMLQYKEMYKNPLFVILLTYMEILPIGLVICAISALILKRKTKPGATIQA
jgi:hypothetical protein